MAVRTNRVVVPGRSVVVAVMLVGLAACSKSESESRVSASTTPVTTDGVTTTEAATTTTASSMSTTTSTTTTTLPALTDPETPGVPTNEEWITILDALYVRLTAMYADPPHADVSLVCLPGSECDEIFSAQIADKVSRREHDEGTAPTKVAAVQSVVDVGSTSNGAIEMATRFEIQYTVAPEDSPGKIVDENGQTIAVITNGDPTPQRTRTVVRFPQDPELPWRIVD